MPAAGLYAHTARALATRPVSAAIPNAELHPWFNDPVLLVGGSRNNEQASYIVYIDVVNMRKIDSIYKDEDKRYDLGGGGIFKHVLNNKNWINKVVLKLKR